MTTRCRWCTDDPIYRDYHDHEWGVPEHDEHRLFELLVLEGAQAGLAWLTILKKRDAYRRAFADFDPAKVARFNDDTLAALARDTSIVRNRAKITAARTNARAFIDIQAEFARFDAYLWAFVDGQPVINRWRRLEQVPTATPLSEKLARDLKQRGFRFVGATICYAYLQAAGVVMDHTTDCFRYRQLAG